MSQLPGAEAEKLFRAILGAYAKDELQRLLWFNLDTDLTHVVGADNSFGSIVFGVIRHIERLGTTDRLLDALEHDRAENGPFLETIRAVRASAERAAAVPRGRPEADPGHPLRRFPPGPMVPFDWIPRSLNTQFATRFYDPHEIQRAVLDAIRERHAADPDAGTIVLPGLLHPAKVEATAFWGDTFIRACPHGPRMVAALVCLIPEELFPAVARKEINDLLRDLSTIQ
jgi:hypothetical protein